MVSVEIFSKILFEHETHSITYQVLSWQHKDKYYCLVFKVGQLLKGWATPGGELPYKNDGGVLVIPFGTA